MPERDKFPKEYFKGNPYEEDTPEETYSRLRWGNQPKEYFEISAPEPLVTLGDVAKICTEYGDIEYSEDQAPFLAIGKKTNYIYFVPKLNGNPINVPDSDYTYRCMVTQIDYYSDKGGEDAYYYHQHEPPYPHLFQHPESGVCILIPSKCADGSRSYAVGDEGVIG